MKISKHFSDWELLSPNLINAINKAKVPASWYISQNQIDALEDIRVKFDKSVFVNVNEKMAKRYGFSEAMYRKRSRSQLQ